MTHLIMESKVAELNIFFGLPFLPNPKKNANTQDVITLYFFIQSKTEIWIIFFFFSFLI